MTIFVLSRGIPNAHEPQWGSFEFDQAKALAGLGHSVLLLGVDSRFRFYLRKLGVTKQVKEDVICYNSFYLPGAIVSLLGSSLLAHFQLWQWKRLVKRAVHEYGKPDVIYSHYLFNSYFAVRLKQVVNAPVVAMEHWSEINKPTLLPSVQRMGDEVYPQVDRLLTVSQAAQRAIKHHFNQDATVVYNMISDTFTYVKRVAPDHKVRFIATGSLIRRKGFDLLIEAFNRLQLPDDTWELNIIGAGKEHNALSGQIASAHLEQHIHLSGAQTADRIACLLNQSDVFVLPSRMETFGVVYTEAMACGLPVIATPCGGPEEFVNQKNGLLVPVDDIQALANAIQYMYYHHQQYDRQAIAAECHERFSSEVIARQLTAIFEKVVKKEK